MPKRLGRYRILEEIGAGAVSVVHRAYDERLDREVALKVVHRGLLEEREQRQRFETEARTLSQLNHASIEQIYDYDSRDGEDFLVMEFIPGETLQHRLAAGPLPQREVIHLGSQLCDALAAAHERGIVHRDLKPGNIMVTPSGRLKVLDFGMARKARTGTSTQALEVSDDATVLGAMPYVTPEQIQGQPADARSDVHALGAILFEMATGRRAFAATGSALMSAILEQSPPSPRTLNPRVSQELADVVQKCMRKAPRERYATARDVLADLKRLESVEARAERRWRHGRRQVRRLLVAAATLAGLTAAVWVWRATLPAPEGIVVLPFESLGDEEQNYYADAVANELFNRLVTVSNLRVVSWTSARAVDANASLQEIAADLGVDAVVEGTVLRAVGDVQISIRLTRVHAGSLFKRGREEVVMGVDRTLPEGDVLRQLGGFATVIAEQFADELLPAERQRLAGAASVMPASFDAYARGRFEWSRREPSAFERAIQSFERAIDEDSTFAPAYAGLADCYALFGSIGYDIIPPRRAMPLARHYAQRALRFDADLPQAHTALAHIHHNFDWDWESAERAFERALLLAPNDPTTRQWYGFFLASMGRIDDGIKQQQRGLEVEPESIILQASLARLHYYKREYATTLEYVDAVLDREPDFLPATVIRGMAYLQMGRFGDALTTFQRGFETTGGAPVFQAGIGAVHAVTGDRAGAEGVIESLAARGGYVPAYYTAAIYAKLGEAELALEWFDRAYEERSEPLLYLALDPWVDELRGRPRFLDLLQRIGLPQHTPSL